MDFHNATHLNSTRLLGLLLQHTRPYRHDRLTVRVRYSRSADFSGSCYYGQARIFVNLGRHLRFPYYLGTHVARAQSDRMYWWRETYRLIVRDAYQLALFVYRHELYHFLVKAAGRDPRRKEAMCDRFAVRALVDQCGCPLVDWRGHPVARELWDFQDLEAFVAAAPREAPSPGACPWPRPLPVVVRGVRTGTRRSRSGPPTHGFAPRAVAVP